jgi:hypothetical protein
VDKEKTFMFHTTKTRVTLVFVGLALFSFLTYLYLIKMINSDAWSGLIALDLFIVIVIIALIERRKKQSPPQNAPLPS